MVKTLCMNSLNESIFVIIMSDIVKYVSVQESIMDFYWHYVSKDTIDEAGKDSFLRAISMASQIFNSISEYIQVNLKPLSIFVLIFLCEARSPFV